MKVTQDTESNNDNNDNPQRQAHVKKMIKNKQE